MALMVARKLRSDAAMLIGGILNNQSYKNCSFQKMPAFLGLHMQTRLVRQLTAARSRERLPMAQHFSISIMNDRGIERVRDWFG